MGKNKKNERRGVIMKKINRLYYSGLICLMLIAVFSLLVLCNGCAGKQDNVLNSFREEVGIAVIGMEIGYRFAENNVDKIADTKSAINKIIENLEFVVADQDVTYLELFKDYLLKDVGKDAVEKVDTILMLIGIGSDNKWFAGKVPENAEFKITVERAQLALRSVKKGIEKYTEYSSKYEKITI